MLTGLAFMGGFLLVVGIGGALVENTPLGKHIDNLTKDLPMMWDWSEIRK